MADGRYLMLGEEPRPYVYRPLSQQYRSPVTLTVRSASDPAALVPPLTRLVRELGPDLPAFNVRTMEALGPRACSASCRCAWGP